MGVIPFPLDAIPGEIRKAPGDVTVALDELAIVSSKAEEGAKLLHVVGRFPGFDFFDVLRIWGNAVPGELVPEAHHRLASEGALGRVQLQVSLAEGRQDKVQVLEVILHVRVRHEDAAR